MDKFTLEERILTFIVLLIVVIAFSAVLITPYFEMKAFNKFSKTKATYIDALFTNLRVIPD